MPTETEAKEAQLRIQLLYSMGLAAIKLNDLASYTAATRELDAICQDPDFTTAMRNEAANYHKALGETLLEVGRQELADIIAELGAARDELRKASKTARAGRDDLSLPAAAKAANEFLDAVNDAANLGEEAKNLLRRLLDGLKGLTPSFR
jgi:hypothetical protein